MPTPKPSKTGNQHSSENSKCSGGSGSRGQKENWDDLNENIETKKKELNMKKGAC